MRKSSVRLLFFILKRHSKCYSWEKKKTYRFIFFVKAHTHEFNVNWYVSEKGYIYIEIKHRKVYAKNGMR